MLKITGQKDEATQEVALVIEGRLAGPWVAELEAFCRVVSENRPRCTMIDLSGVTYIDAHGKALLACLWQAGAELRASGCLTRCVVEEITGTNLGDELCENDKNAVSENSASSQVK